MKPRRVPVGLEMTIRTLTLEQLNAMPTVREGWTAHLKYEDADTRVWLERVGKEDGRPYDNMVTVEHFDGDRWRIVREYEAL